MTIGELLSRLGERAPWGKAAAWDPVGLQLGDPAKEAESVAVCHEVTERIVTQVVDLSPDLVVSYHPLLFRATNRLVAGRTPEGRALRLVGEGVALAVSHTNFDSAPGGTADALAEALGLTEVSVFGPVVGASQIKVVTFVPQENVTEVTTAMASAGAGVIGNYSHCSYRSDGLGTFYSGAGTSPTRGAADQLNKEPEVRLEMIAPKAREARVIGALIRAHPYEEPALDIYDSRSNPGLVGRVGSVSRPNTLEGFSRQVGERLGTERVRFAGDPQAPVERVAVVPGAGSGFIDPAIDESADVLVTGDVSHHRVVHATDRGLGIIDPGHVAGERPGLTRLYAVVAEAVPEAVDLTDVPSDPWTWSP